MKYTFSLELEDYLTHQLYVASTSGNVQKNRRRSWFWSTTIFLAIAWIMELSENPELRNYFLIMALITLVFFPFYIKRKYRNHYERHVKTNLSENFKKEATVTFEEDHVFLADENGSESKVAFAQVKAVHELPNHYLMFLKGGQTLIFPKDKIEEKLALRQDLIKLAEAINTSIEDHTDWKWK